MRESHLEQGAVREGIAITLYAVNLLQASQCLTQAIGGITVAAESPVLCRDGTCKYGADDAR